MAAELPRGAPRAGAASFNSLPPDVLGLIGERLLEDGPLWDRGDCLQLACNLAAVGNEATTLLAGSLFSILSPRLGQELPNGVTEGSSVSELKAPCKSWGLPVTGTKQALHQLMEQFEDSVAGSDDEPPRFCLVSGATRAELTGHSRKRISQSKCKDIFDLTKSSLSGLPFEWQHSGTGFPGKMFLLKEVKALVLRRRLDQVFGAAAAHEGHDERVGHAAKTERRRAELKAEMLLRGYPAERVQSLLAESGASIYVWGSHYKDVRPAEACSAIELLGFARGPALSHFVAAFQADTWQPSKSMSQYVADHRRRERAAQAALPRWVAAQQSLEAIQSNLRVPASLLPRLQALWAARSPAQQQQQQQQQTDE